MPAPDDVYPLAPAAALAKLRQANITGFRDARQSGTISWRVTSDTIPVAAFTLRVTPEGNGSRIAIELPKGPKGNELYDGKQKYTHPALMQPMPPALRELIHAAIDGRGFDWKRIPYPLNTDGFCGSMRQNFEASGHPYSINDRYGMTHEQAEEMRAKGISIPAEHDQIFAGRGNSWAN